jgi:polyphosphate kinase
MNSSWSASPVSKAQVREGIVERSPDGKTPAEQLELILKEIDNLQMEQQAIAGRAAAISGRKTF